ncbi:MAG: AbrB/MazE/SpoVT family DNA-binding domain-containing protein [Pseudomonadota bacterium]|nr:AbrB/MazE/SpoVT family DNA-binding domain-containing protein [Pseudomonadota bacterium]
MVRHVAGALLLNRSSSDDPLDRVNIGNSRSIRLPKSLLDKYAITDTVVIEEREDESPAPQQARSAD